ncbi:MAG TPA: glycosyltransferase family 4 protein [Solirubrobacterales bacterium]|nr:glycosyltransferase family 4 protein [Solirubrobacterales bacterium]
MGELSPAVLWVSPTVSSSFGGPTTTTVNGLVAEKRAGLNSSLLTTTSGDDRHQIAPAVERLAANDIKVRLFRRTGLLAKSEAWGFSASSVIWMARNLRRYDLIHLQYVWCITSIFGSILGKILRVPVVITPHESLTDYDIDVASRSRRKRLVKLALRQLYLRTADRLIFMSELEEKDTRSGAVPYELISHAVQEEIAIVKPRTEDLTPGVLRIGFLGRNIPKKGIDLIIRAIGRNPERHWELAIAGPPGTDEFRDEMARLVRELEVGDRIRWVGFLPERSDLFRACDVLAMPSAYEGFGMVAAEALCNGVPVIVPNRTGVAEIVKEFEAGIVIPEAGVEELENALEVMEDDSTARSRFSENGLRAANSRLSYAAFAAATSKLYKSLISG